MTDFAKHCVAYMEGHLDFFNPEGEFENLHEDLHRFLMHPNNRIVTVKKDNKIICIASCQWLRHTVGEVAILIDKSMRQNKLFFVKAIHWLMEEYLVGSLGYERLQMGIKCDEEDKVKWAESLGFEREGIMKGYDAHNVDHYLYARLWR